MHLVVVGFSHKNTPLSLREALAFDREKAASVSKSLIGQDVIEEAMAIVTCNRTEIYAVGSCTEGVKETIYQLLAKSIGREATELGKVAYHYYEESALRHIFRVASSLDAMVVGEAQVLGQFKSAYQAAVEYNTVGPYLHKACHSAFRAAKRVRTETDIAALPVSIGSLAVDMALDSYPELNRANILIIGAGEMSTLVANHLKEQGAAHIWVANRSHPSAELLAHAIGGIVVPFDSWDVHMQTADIVILSIGGGVLIKKNDIETAISEREDAKLVMLDLAIPRNIDPAVGKISGVKLYNIDDLQGLAEKNLALRRKFVELAEKIVSEEAHISFQDIQQIKLAPMITDLHKKCASIVRTGLEELYKANPGMSEEERGSVRECVSTVVKKILHDPIRLAKEELARPGANGKEVATILQKIFQIER